MERAIEYSNAETRLTALTFPVAARVQRYRKRSVTDQPIRYQDIVSYESKRYYRELTYERPLLSPFSIN